MDKTDHEILKILQKKARIPNVEVARTIGMAPSAILERIKKMENKGIIQGYEVRLDPHQFNCSLIAFIHVSVRTPGDVHKTGRALAQIDQVQEVHYISGQDVLLVKLKTAGHEQLETVLSRQIARIDTVRRTHTYTVLSTFKESAKIPMPDLPAEP